LVLFLKQSEAGFHHVHLNISFSLMLVSATQADLSSVLGRYAASAVSSPDWTGQEEVEIAIAVVRT
jgi:hypothetical protein